MKSERATRSTSLLSLAIFATAIVGCGKANDALDATIAMNAKMDKTNEGMKNTNDGMAKTNAMMEKMVAGMDKSNVAVDKTNEGMSQTNSSIHKQTLGVAFETLLKAENTKYVSPGSVTPTSMMAGSKILAIEATALELVELTYVTILEINTAQPFTRLADAENPRFTAEIKAKTDADKWIKFTALQVISGLVPQATIETMVNEQIVQGGRYEGAAYAVLLLRHLFIQSYLLDATLIPELTGNLTNTGSFEQALEYVKQLKYIEKSVDPKYVAIQITGYFDEEKPGAFNKTWTLMNPTTKKLFNVATDYYPQLKAALKQLQSRPRYRNPTGSSVSAKLTAIKQEIENGVAGN